MNWTALRQSTAMWTPRPAGARAGLATALRLWALAYACLLPILAVAVLALWIGRYNTSQPFQPFAAVTLLVDWATWATLAPLVVALVWRMPLNSGGWIRGLSAHLVMGGLLALVELALFVSLVKLVGGFRQTTFELAYWRMLTLWYPYALLVYWVIAVAAHAVLESRRASEREVEAARLREQLTTAQLDALRMQLHPHFLCNTLNTVAVFLRDGMVHQAGEIVTGLGGLLHIALDRMEEQEIPLRDELAFVQQYLDIERIRFSDRMVVSVQADRSTLDGLVPSMILQPVVENAVKHGISRDPRCGRVTIRTARVNERLLLAVEDDGPGLRQASAPDGHGVGLHNTRMRLERLYGDHGSLEIRNAGSRGVLVEISVPFHTTTAPAAASEPVG